MAAAELPIFDAHVHYSHDAWENLPPKEAIAILRKAGLKRALVSSSGDEGTQRLVAEAPELIVPSLRPYRSRGELSSWVRDDSVVAFLEERLAQEPLCRGGRVPPLRRRCRTAGAAAHGGAGPAAPAGAARARDADAIERVFLQYPQARILWAHSGFERPEGVAALLRKHKNLWCDLAFRSEHGGAGQVPPEWRALFDEFPDRFMVGTDTYTPERWLYVNEHANWSRAWLATLPPPLAERIAWKNAEALFAGWKAGGAQ